MNIAKVFWCLLVTLPLQVWGQSVHVPEGSYYGHSPTAVVEGEVRAGFFVFSRYATVFGKDADRTVSAALRCSSGFSFLSRLRISADGAFEGGCSFGAIGTREARGTFPNLEFFTSAGSWGTFSVSLIPDSQRATFLAALNAGTVSSTGEWIELNRRAVAQPVSGPLKSAPGAAGNAIPAPADNRDSLPKPSPARPEIFASGHNMSANPSLAQASPESGQFRPGHADRLNAALTPAPVQPRVAPVASTGQSGEDTSTVPPSVDPFNAGQRQRTPGLALLMQTTESERQAAELEAERARRRALEAQLAAEATERERLSVEARDREQLTVELREQLRMRTQTAKGFLPKGGRHALVIGIDQYQRVARLRNAVADAREVASTLRGFGYAVREHRDLAGPDFRRALREFRTQVNPGDEVVVFYAGHGVQINGLNYFLPADTRGDSEAEVRDEAVQLQRLLDDLADARPSFALVIADACRDNPFKGHGRPIAGRGLSPTTVANGQMILFSAGSNQRALDTLGPDDRVANSVFTRVLIAEMRKPNLPIDRLVRNVRAEVVRLARLAGHDQVPALYDQSIGEFFLSRQP